MNKKDIKNAARELNKVLGLDPQINITLKQVELENLVLEAAELIEPADKITKATKATIEGLKQERQEAEETEEFDNTSDMDVTEEEEAVDPEPIEEEEEAEEAEEAEEEAPKKKKTGKVVPLPEKKAEKKETAEKKPAPKTKAEPGGKTLATIMDEVLSAGGAWDAICEKIVAEGEKFGYTAKQCAPGMVKAHAKYRISKGKLNIEITDKGVKSIK